jgi:hypothetical protein
VRIGLISLALAQTAQLIISPGTVLLGLRAGLALGEVLILSQSFGWLSRKKLGMNGQALSRPFHITDHLFVCEIFDLILGK